MAWIEFHATRIVKLKKFQDFRTYLQMSKHEALGLLGSFWCEVIELREDGDITDWNPEYLAELLGFKLSPDRVWKALEAGWIDDVNGRKVLHDWWDTAGTYLTSKYHNSNKEKLSQIKDKLQVGFLKESKRNPLPCLPNPTIPNQPNLTKPKENQAEKPAEFSREFVQKAEAAKGLGFNIYQLTGKFYKTSKVCEKLPEDVLDSVLDEVIKRHEHIKDPFPYFLTVLKSKSSEYFSLRNQLESKKIKSQPVSIKAILEGICAKA